MQIRANIKYDFISIRMAKRKNTDNTKSSWVFPLEKWKHMNKEEKNCIRMFIAAWFWQAKSEKNQMDGKNSGTQIR